MENVTLTQKEQTRLQVLNGLLAEHMALDQAATLMGVTTRHTRRILAAYREKGVAAVAHGHRGRRPANATPDAVVAGVVRLARTRYAGANHTHLSELLSEREGIDIGRTTLRRILVNAGLSSPRRRRPPKHRVRRQRMPREGMLVQLDGSHHRWLGEDGPQFTILIAVDDATSCVVNALFCEHEDTNSYFLLMQGLLRRCGIPLALYTDRHGVFRHTPGSGLPGMPTQFSRAMDSRAEDEQDQGAITGSAATTGKPKAASARKPTFLQRERWKAIQKARGKGMSLRAIERELGIHRATIKKYMDTEGPPTRQSRAAPATSSPDMAALPSDIYAGHLNGHLS